LPGISILSSSVTANSISNFSVAESDLQPAASGQYICNITFAYTHIGRNDRFNVWYWLPSPSQFQNRFLATGGGGFAITSGQGGLSQGLPHGAAAGTTDGGLGSWNAQLTDKILLANGTMDYTLLNAFSHEAIHEMSVLGKELTRKFYNSTSKVYSYYQGCSEGGREGFSQLQRYSDQFDGAAVGAPAMRMAFQQVIHLFSALVEQTNGYAPSSCEMTRINNDTLKACDGLDGRLDGVVSRTDLCMLNYNATSSIGTSYACAASRGGGFGPGGPPGGGYVSPAVSGTVTDKAVNIANDIWKGLFDSQGKQVYISFRPSADFGDAATTYNNATGKYQATVSGIGVQWVNYFLREVASTSLDLSNSTYDTLRDWILDGMRRYSDTLQTNWPDLEGVQKYGGKIIHYHGESDPSIPSGSSVIYHDAVRQAMFPKLGFQDGYRALNDFYRFYLVPGAGHCGRSQDQPNGPFPTSVLSSVIDWVEKGVIPTTLNSTTPTGEVQGLCTWPLRPLWANTTMQCVYDQKSIDTWLPKLDSIPVPVW
jgi:tannase